MSEATANVLLKISGDSSEAQEAVAAVEGSLGSLGKVAKVAGGALATAGVVQFFRGSVKAAESAETSWTRLGIAVKGIGVNWQKARPEIEKSIASLSKLSGFSGGELRQALTKLIQSTGDYQESLKLMDLVQKVAAASGQSLATSAMAVGRAYQGQTMLLKRWFPALKQIKDTQELLAKTAEITATALDDMGETSEVRAKRAANELNKLKTTIGKSLLPVMNEWYDLQIKVLSGLNEMPEGVKAATAGIGGLGTAAAGALPALANISQIVGTVWGTAELWKLWGKKIVDVMATVTLAWQTGAGALGGPLGAGAGLLFAGALAGLGGAGASGLQWLNRNAGYGGGALGAKGTPSTGAFPNYPIMGGTIHRPSSVQAPQPQGGGEWRNRHEPTVQQQTPTTRGEAVVPRMTDEAIALARAKMQVAEAEKAYTKAREGNDPAAQEKAALDLAAAQNGLATATTAVGDAAKNTARDLKGLYVDADSYSAKQRAAREAKLDYKQALIDERGAERALTAAKKDGTKDEIRQAQINLARAHQRVRDAAVDSKIALEEAAKAGKEAAKDKSIINWWKNLGTAIRGASDAVSPATKVAMQHSFYTPSKPDGRGSGAIVPATYGGQMWQVAYEGSDELLLPLNRSRKSQTLLRNAARTMGFELQRVGESGGASGTNITINVTGSKTDADYNAIAVKNAVYEVLAAAGA